ncbi:MAG: SAM-dependent methyltransferase [Gammaproteobacteria bacterium]
MLSPPNPNAFPVPSDKALRVSAELSAIVRSEIARAGGFLDFARYMELALYAPGLGYYSAGSVKFGSSGDFVTAPELSTTFGRALAATLGAELEANNARVVLELGAGSGALAAQLLDAWDLQGRGVDYWILEPSADLRERQRRTLARFEPRVRWLDRLPVSPFRGAIVANEVLDALPVSCFAKEAGETHAVGVVNGAAGFEWAARSGAPDLVTTVARLEASLGGPLADGYRSELCLALPAWLDALAASLDRGSLFFVDYGLTRGEYYHPQRSGGTLVCHYRHRVHADPFVYPGLQDITAWVDFSAVADAAAGCGLTLAGFTTQAQYLIALLAANPSAFGVDAASPREQSALKTLILPGEMGERFKVLLLRKGVAGPSLPGRDFRARLSMRAAD